MLPQTRRPRYTLLSTIFLFISPASQAQPPSVVPKPPVDKAAIERGQTQFVATCGFCHGSNGKGGEGGPDLVRSVLVLDDENGASIGPVILNGRVEKGMPKFNFTAAQVSDIVAFLHSRTEAAANRGSYTILNVVTGDPKAGEAYFNGKCATCHQTGGDLAGIAKRYEPAALQERFLYPRGRRRPGAAPAPTAAPVMVTVTLPNGRSVSGKLETIDDFDVSLRDSEGQYQGFARDPGVKVEIHDPLDAHEALLKQYTDKDMHNVLAYLETMK